MARDLMPSLTGECQYVLVDELIGSNVTSEVELLENLVLLSGLVDACCELRAYVRTFCYIALYFQTMTYMNDRMRFNFVLVAAINLPEIVNLRNALPLMVSFA